MTKTVNLVNQILTARGICTKEAQAAFLQPDYEQAKHDPFRLPDMDKAIKRLQQARERHEQVTIYGDYDVDGITATSLLLDALPKFGLKVNYYLPDRFKEGYGLNKDAVRQLAKAGTDVILTVDNGIVSFDEVARANELGVDVIVTDHHSPRDTLPPAAAVVDPKILAYRNPEKYDKHYLIKSELQNPGVDKGGKKNQVQSSNPYPFCDMCGCGVAFKLVQALQTIYPDDLPLGQEKWLLDLVALGTVSDVVSLVDENRAYVRWGLEVIKKTRRPGIRALAAVAGIKLNDIDSRSIGFVLGPRLNASGRLASARLAVEMLSTDDNDRALELATKLGELNDQRKQLQNEIYEQAVKQVNPADPVAIAVGDGWHEGVIGIVASKVEEKFERPAFVFSRKGNEVKASGRSFGDFSVAALITKTSDLLLKGGGHVAAGGLTVAADNFTKWCQAAQEYYRSLNLTDQLKYLYPQPDLTIIDFSNLTVRLVKELARLEPFGEGNPVPTFQLHHVLINDRRTMGKEGNHVRYTFLDNQGNKLQAVAFNCANRFTLGSTNEVGEPQYADALVSLDINEWNGLESVQGKLIKLDAC